MALFRLSIICCITLFLGAGKVYCQKTSSQELQHLRASLKRTGQDTSRIDAFTMLGDYYLFLPGERKDDLDSAFNFYGKAIALSKKLHNDEWVNRVKASLASWYYEAENPHQGTALFKEIIRFYQKSGNRAMEAYSLRQLGSNLIAEKLHNHQQEGLLYYEQAIDVYKKLGDRQKAIELTSGKALVYFSNGKLEKAEKAFLKMHQDLNKIGYYGESDGTALDYLAYIAQARGDFSAAFRYALENLENLKKHPNDFLESRKANIYLRLSAIYLDAGNFTKAEFYARQYLPIVLQERMDYTPGLNILVKSLIAEKKPSEALKVLNGTIKNAPTDSVQQISVFLFSGDIYKALRYTRIAEKNYLAALNLYNAISPLQRKTYRTANLYLSLSNFYVSMQEFEKAKKVLEHTDQTIQTFTPLSKSKLALVRSKIDSAEGRYLPALKAFQYYKELSDTIFDIQKSHQMSQLEVTLEVRQKQDKINLLSAQNKASLAFAQKAKVERNITFIGILIALVFSLITFFSFRAKIRSNRLLTARQQEINEKNASLQTLVNEKEVLLAEKEGLIEDKDILLKEVHHRVKNNLQIVMSLLSTQLEYLENSEALQALEESQQRVQAIALIHQKLYRDKGGVSVQMQSYIADMVDDLDSSFNARKRNIKFELSVEAIHLDIDQAVPVGLVLNEAITNAIKYAFRDDNGKVNIAVSRAKGRVNIKISDNGSGLPDDFDLNVSNTLGMEMMKGLTKQLLGTFEISGRGGVSILLSFPYREKVLIA
ncbi:histidine kinase dimerization/phosphoacceptor domain -containing protein [Mucilaginibacter lutimaris]|uniref:histidine kinase n=1 Tax=Mucilaginibacter lutimaris TaxID=931629 RepID=A0ABW2ZEF1_9SPHI